MRFVNVFLSDWIKIRKQFLTIHILIPLIGAIMFLLYYSISSWDFTDEVYAYFETISLIFPLMIGIITALATEQEFAAGYFQNMISGSINKISTFNSKIIWLILFGLLSSIISMMLFGAGMIVIFDNNLFDISFYFLAASVIILGNIFLYILHLVISLKYGKGASIGLGIFESLIAALFLTGLGDAIWFYVPAAWGGRLLELVVYFEFNNPVAVFEKGLITCIVMSICALLFSNIWFVNWEGRHSDN